MIGLTVFAIFAGAAITLGFLILGVIFYALTPLLGIAGVLAAAFKTAFEETRTVEVPSPIRRPVRIDIRH